MTDTVTANASEIIGNVTVDNVDYYDIKVVAAQAVLQGPSFGTSNAENFTVGYPAAAVAGVTPPVWLAGTTFPVTITGTGFGTQPTVTISALGVTPVTTTTTSDGMTISIPAVSVAASAPYEPVSVQVRPGYVENSFVCGTACTGNGSAVSGTPDRAVVAFPITPNANVELYRGSYDTTLRFFLVRQHNYGAGYKPNPCKRSIGGSDQSNGFGLSHSPHFTPKKQLPNRGSSHSSLSNRKPKIRADMVLKRSPSRTNSHYEKGWRAI